MPDQERSKMERLSSVIIQSIFKGGAYGALIAIPTDILLRWKSPSYRWLGTRGRIFYYTIWIASCANFATEKGILRFENMIRYEDQLKKEKLMELAVEKGDYGLYDDDDFVNVQHKGGKKQRDDVAAARPNRDELITKGGGHV